MARAKLYELNEAVIGENKFKGQSALIVRSLLNRHPQTAQEIAEDIKRDLQTRQDPLRVVSFYLSTWKKAGWINVVGTVGEKDPVPTEGPEEQAASPAYEAPVPTPDFDDEPAAPAIEEFDYANASTEDAVLQMLSTFDSPVSPKTIADELNVVGRTIKAKQVGDVIRKLVKHEKVVKVADGEYSIADTVVQ